MNEPLFPRREEPGEGSITCNFRRTLRFPWRALLALLAVGRRGHKGSVAAGPSLSSAEEVATLQLLAGLSRSPALPSLIAASFVLHFRAFSSTAQCQTPSHCPSPACHSYSGRWRWQPGAAPEGRWEEPREGEVLGQGDRARRQLHRTWGRLSLQPACSWSPEVRNSPISRTSSASGHLYRAHHPYQSTRALRPAICICPVHRCIPSA